MTGLRNKEEDDEEDEGDLDSETRRSHRQTSPSVVPAKRRQGDSVKRIGETKSEQCGKSTG